eukprot:1240510-Amphidinium_carterae.1
MSPKAFGDVAAGAAHSRGRCRALGICHASLTGGTSSKEIKLAHEPSPKNTTQNSPGVLQDVLHGYMAIMASAEAQQSNLFLSLAPDGKSQVCAAI